MKCAICGKKVETTFLQKPLGSYFKVGKKKKIVCSNCQRTLKTKEAILEKL